MTSLTFPEKMAAYDYQTDNLVVQGTDGQRRVRCVVPAKTLQDRFGARGRSQKELMTAFARGWDEIREAAARKFVILGGGLHEIVLMPRDFGAVSDLELSLAKHLKHLPQS